MPAKDTKEEILDSAERLFAERGVEGTSLRAITTEAGVNLAAVHYHFGSKKALVQAMLRRRFASVNEDRYRRLAELEEQAGKRPPSVEAVLEAFLAPVLDLFDQMDDTRLLPRLIARIYLDSDSDYREVVQEEFRGVLEHFWRSLLRALPGLPPQELLLRIQFLAGAFHHALAGTHFVEQVNGIELEELDTASFLQRMISFTAAGLRAPAAAADKQSAA